MDQNTKEPKVELQLGRRDWKILSGLEKWGILGVGQINGLGSEGTEEERVRLMFNDWRREDSTTRVSKRLRQLEDAALIKAHYYVNQLKLHTLAEKGYRMLKARGLASLPGYRDHVDEAQISHELAVNATGLIMTELLGLVVRTERERFVWPSRGGRAPAPERAVSDLWVVDKAQPKAIEVELSQKSRSRYDDIFDAYRRRLPRGGVVLYLTAWPSGVTCILDHARNARAPFVYACSITEFRRTAGRAPFLSGFGDRLCLKGELVEAAR